MAEAETRAERPGLGARGRAAVIILTLATVAGAWLLSPPWWNSLGNDSRVFFSAAGLADAGGNPYDFELLSAEEKRVNQAAPPNQRQAFSPAPYAYPPLMTAVYESLLPLGERGFYWANVAILVTALALAYRLSAVGARWRNHRLGAIALAASAPSILGLVAGNPSNLVFLAWAAGFYALARGRPVTAGAILAFTLIKPPIGLATTAALVLATPASVGPVLLGFGAGTALFMAANLLVAGPAALASWLEALVGFLSGINVPGSANQQCCLAGLPALLLDRTATIVAIASACVVVAVILVVAMRRPSTRAALRRDWLGRLALFTAAALAVSPYLHLNDLVLLTVPLMVVASRRLSVVSVTALVTWGLGVVLPLLISVVLALLVRHQVISSVGYGVVITLLTLLAVATAASPPRESTEKAPARPWGPIPSA